MGRLVAAWEAAADIAAEWAKRTAAVTADSFRKLTSDPDIRAAMAAWRVVFIWERMECECTCATAHPDDVAVCDRRAVITRRLQHQVRPGGRPALRALRGGPGRRRDAPVTTGR